MPDPRAEVGTSRRMVGVVFALGITALALTMVAVSLTVGTQPLDASQVFDALLGRASDPDHELVVRYMRLPRTVLALLVGSSQAVAGGVMQGVTRNPLASPSLAGLTSGGTLGLLLSILLIPEAGYPGMMASSFLGATAAVVTVYAIALRSRAGISPARLAIAGLMVSVFLASITGLLVFEYGLATAGLSWRAGALISLRWSEIGMALPVYGIGMLLALALAPQITVLNLGSEVARALGQRSELVVFLAMISVLFLAGTAVSIAGPVGFVGLFVPHLVRWIVGHDYRLVLPVSALAGALFVLSADVVTRDVKAGFFEVPLGLVTATVGLPFFLVYARFAGRRGGAR